MARTTMTLLGLIGFATVVALAGCDTIIGLLPQSRVTVTVVNDSPDFNVDGTLIYGDERNTLKELLIALSPVKRDFSLAPGMSTTFSDGCDDLRAIVLEDADLRVIVGLSPDTDSDLLRIDDDFECGQEIIFTFTHTAITTDFNVAITVQ